MKKEDFINLCFLCKEVYRQEKKTFFIVIAYSLLEAINPYILVLLSGYIVDLALNKADDKRTFIAIGSMLVVKGVINLISSYFQELYSKKLEEYPKEFASRELINKALNMNYKYLEDSHIQDIRFRAFQHSFYGVGGWLLIQLRDLVRNIATIAFAIVIMTPMIKNNYFRGHSLLMIFALIILIFFNYRVSVNNTRKAMNVFRDDSNLYNKKMYYLNLFSKVEPQKDIRLMKMENMICRDVEYLFQKIQESENKQGEFYVRRALLQRIALNVSMLIIYLYVAVCALLNFISVGQVVTYAASMNELILSVNKLAINIGHMKSAAIYAADYREFLNIDNNEYNKKRSLNTANDNKVLIEFENVSFRYPGTESYVFKNFSYKFEVNNKIALVGINGSGKTTFVKLLCRLYEPEEGKISLNGININEYDLKEYCNLLSVVFQDFKLFGFNLGENIAATDAYDIEKVWNAIHKVGLDKLNEKLSEGLNTYIGKEYSTNGVNFSGGEMQKIAVARAIFKNAPLVVLDEPTAALDPEAEMEMFLELENMIGTKPSIYISHRLTSCKFCSTIYAFDEGRVVQHGNHQKLLEEEGLYRDMWESQAKHYNC